MTDSNGLYPLFSLVLYHELGKGRSHEMNGRMGYRSPIPLIDLSAICTMTEELRDQSLLIPTDSDSNGPYTLFSLVLYHELGK